MHRVLGRTCRRLGWLLLGLSGCQRPWGAAPAQPSLQQVVQQAIAQELSTEHSPPSVPLQTTASAGSGPDVLATLAPRRAELEAMGPLAEGSTTKADLGVDLTGQPPHSIGLTLAGAIEAAVNNNLATQSSRLQPRITTEEALSAQAVFDAVLFANADLSWIDEPQSVPVLLGVPLGTPFNRSERYRFETGVRKRFEWGTQAYVSTDVTRFRNLSPGIVFSPDPAYTAALRIGVDQPLLRGFGSEVNTATIRIARNQQRRSAQQVQSDLLTLVSQTEAAYWNLDAAWKRLEISQWLVDQGVQVRDVLAQRQQVDARPAQYADAVARVEQRQADVIRARRQIRAASDALKALINDPQFPVASEVALRPLDSPPETPIEYNLREAILTAAEHRPEIRQASLDIEDASIRQRVADNDRLPLLNVSAQAAFFGLDNDFSGSYTQSAGDFIDYLLGISFEWPLGNRAADANERAARLRRAAANLGYQRAVQQVVVDVKNALRDVVTNFQLIRATRSFRVAQAENLRALEVEEQFLASLTPEFLNLKFTRQETLAQARAQEVQAVADFNRSLGELYRAMGTGLKMKGIRVEIDDAAESTSMQDPLSHASNPRAN